ncbi:hypothetical protein ANANG_G00239000 [Anguilla anguilla]|uniref:Uncharacterized protein n=1 Tax=Anguilla anguilla TaxID=7936 RepID=A0A9D3LX66_ANGAN|nr:hypothetical protein ANANG_G00239000 [Anguilla anguilla]
MGQVLGFSHCKEFGSVSSTPDSSPPCTVRITPDSSPPCTDGGNEESDFPELQTAREWSDDEYGGEDDEGGPAARRCGGPRDRTPSSSPSPTSPSPSRRGRASRRDSAGGGRRRGGARAGRVSVNRVDTDESLVPAESPELEWEQHAFLSGEEEEEREDAEEKEEGGERESLSAVVGAAQAERKRSPQAPNIATKKTASQQTPLLLRKPRQCHSHLCISREVRSPRRHHLPRLLLLARTLRKS